jgi:ATP-dependent Clp protease ATP-binding subunit ClpC
VPKINVYLPDELAAAVRDAQIPVSAICQAALERAVREVSAVRGNCEDVAPDVARGPFSRFTPRARAAVTSAQAAARKYGHERVGTEHLLLGILDEGANLALKVLAVLEVEPADLRAELVGSLPAASKKAPPETPPFTLLTKEALEATTKEALALGHNYVGCEHLLLGLLATEQGLASQVLRRLGLELRTTRRTVVGALSGVVHAREQAAAQAPPPAAVEEILRRLEAIEQRLT